MFGLQCASCGIRLQGESFAGPPREWFATREVLAIEEARAGWKDERCPDCQEEEHDAR